ncbi:BOLA class I histocompatibility antigen, alpha chain BL3-7-like [Acanthopagrus schlegelii]
MAAVLVDDILVGYCDTSRKIVEPKQAWVKKLFEDEPQHLQMFTQQCVGGTAIYFKNTIDNLKQQYNQSEELPSVSLLQKTPSSPVSCLATGFYPHRASLVWRKDGEELHEEVDHGEILPNHDGTFQMSVDLKLSSVTPEDWTRYDCVFQLSGVKEEIITRLEKDRIRTNWEEPSKHAFLIIVIMVLIAVVLIATMGFIVYKKTRGERGSEEEKKGMKEDGAGTSN